MQQGQAFFHARKYSQSLIEYRNAIRQNPKSAAAHFGAGRAYQSLGNSPSAITEFQETLNLDPNHKEARTELAAAYLAKQEIGQAEPLIRKALDEHPDDPTPHAVHGRLLSA
jgi:Tfp pilus assembly protein PilF